MLKSLTFITLIFISMSLCAQNKITMSKKGKLNTINCSEKATYENVNGKISISIVTSNGLHLQLNNLSESQFKCGARFTSKTPQLILIDNNNNISYLSNTNVQVLINCKKDSKEYEIIFSGMVKNKKERISITSILKVIPTPKQTVKTF